MHAFVLRKKIPCQQQKLKRDFDEGKKTRREGERARARRKKGKTIKNAKAEQKA